MFRDDISSPGVVGDGSETVAAHEGGDTLDAVSVFPALLIVSRDDRDQLRTGRGFDGANKNLGLVAFDIDLHDCRVQTIGVDGAHFNRKGGSAGADVMHGGWAPGGDGHIARGASYGIGFDADEVGNAVEFDVATQRLDGGGLGSQAQLRACAAADASTV
jgi:hypothetical protein